MSTEALEFKICVMGGDNVGKSSVVRALAGQPFKEGRENIDEDYVCFCVNNFKRNSNDGS